jgi:hypothetical protein
MTELNNTEYTGLGQQIIEEHGVQISEIDDIYSDPKTSSNNLRDIIDWCNKGNIVCLTANNKKPQIYHKDCESNLDTFENHKVIVIRCKMAGLLDEGEWEWYIHNAKICDCKCKNNIDMINDLGSQKKKNLFMFNV